MTVEFFPVPMRPISVEEAKRKAEEMREAHRQLEADYQRNCASKKSSDTSVSNGLKK